MSNTYAADPDVMQTDLESEIILVQGRTGRSFRLNVTARFAWLLLPTTPEALAQALMTKFDVDPPTALRDSIETLDFLAQNSLAVQVS